MVSTRLGEKKLGEGIRVLREGSNGHGFDIDALREDIKSFRDVGVRYALLGIPEDIGTLTVNPESLVLPAIPNL